MKPPTKPSDTRYLVYRGGCWNLYEPSWVRAASRGAFVPAYRDSGFGFRTHLPGRSPRV